MGSTNDFAALMAMLISVIGLVCAQGLGLFLYLNSRINGLSDNLFKRLDAKFDTFERNSAEARRDANASFAAQLAEHNSDIEDLKRNAARHADLREMETRLMTTVGEMRSDMREIGRKVEQTGVDTVRALARLEASVDLASKSQPTT